ncbi:pyridoxamine 5'-phosphate oxidase family protein [Micromonospora deserti]|uniref:pyridoxamine 5'-phosphate oxidase family protein n=1 Tax=Micromonospora deserti TaxID=2070366 RepID=UPI0013142242|nr:pyridoxamine 5'-phosphate oxidase family protein [Micromonospora deserti]
MTQPLHAEPLTSRQPGTPWSEAMERLGTADAYWLVTTGADARPHMVPVLAVLVDGTLHFATSGRSSKARNLAINPECVIAANAPSIDVVHGRATKVHRNDRLRDVAHAYAQKYDWHVTARDGALHDADGAPTAGPPPYDAYALTPTSAYGFATSEALSSTRWRRHDECDQ